MKVRIINPDGRRFNTQVLDAVTGETIRGVRRIELDIGVHELKAKLHIVERPQLDIVVDAEIVRHSREDPESKPAKRM
jgi:hypothetical protein